ncbi:hypothetical protein [Petroclostridium sp. X23]|uniref:hypothetical protein n=1 Tax=Petroclostridium sp. X23 TaxID=3045146 RepID=UPI0024AD82A7|nr:hypothetical protein [Petroclostridium sp. X23]WHH58841.1 hypothetical protein QKW49_24120 [Petroclostridium sp. X23]
MNLNVVKSKKTGIKVVSLSKYGEFKIPIEQILKFDVNDIQIYKQKFISLSRKGIIYSGEFNDNRWILSNAEDFEQRSRVEFETPFGKEPCLALKFYTIVKLEDQYATMGFVKKSVHHIYKFIILSKLFRVEYWNNNVKSWLLKYSRSTQRDIMSILLEFLSFYSVNDSEQYIENILKMLRVEPPTPRKLPNYRSIIWFDFILDHYLQQCKEADKLKYFPVLLWWIITKIIPMRPIEFVSLRINCCEYDSNQGKYFLNIIRRKVFSLEKKMNSREVTQRLQIDKGIYNLIEEYKVCTQDDSDRKYLLSYKKYNDSIELKAVQKSANTQKYNPHVLNLTQLRDLLNCFYSEIIEKQYNKETIIKSHLREAKKIGDDVTDKLVRLQLGDTRHLSICYLLLQGHNPKTIAEMAWHDDINKHLNGYSFHTPEFVDANIHVLAQKIKSMHLDKCNVVNSFLEEPEFIVQRALEMIKGSKEIQRNVEDFGCTSKKFPYECNERRCLYCAQNVLLTDNNDIEQEIRIKAESEKIQEDIKRQLDFIRCFTENMTDIGALDLKTGACDVEAQEKLETASNNLKTRIIQKALLESYILQKDEKNRGINDAKQ